MFRERGIETTVMGITLADNAIAKVKLCAKVSSRLLGELQVAWGVKVKHDAEPGGDGCMALVGIDVRPKAVPEERMVVELWAAPGANAPAVRLRGAEVMSYRLWSDGEVGNLLRFDLVISASLGEQLQRLAGLLGSSVSMSIDVEQEELPLGGNGRGRLPENWDAAMPAAYPAEAVEAAERKERKRESAQAAARVA